MQLIDLLSSEPVDVISADAEVIEAARLMQEINAGLLMVVDEGRFVGVLTDRDIVLRCVAQELPRTTAVREVMSVAMVSAYGDQTVEEAKDLIAEYGISRLPVVDRDHKPIGVLSLASLEQKEPAQKTPVKVTAYKERTDSSGHPHKVPLRTVYVTTENSEEDAKDLAAKIVEKDQKGPFVADGLATEKVPGAADK